MRHLLFVLLALWGLSQSPAYAQDRRVTGKVTDATDGAPIPGATVLVKGTTRGTQTDAQGNYTIQVPNTGTTLVFSFVGTTSQEVTIGTRSQIDVRLSNDARSLNEVVVVGYGTQQARDVKGSIASIKAADLNNVPVQTFEQALAGRAPGVQVTQSSGKLGAGLQIRVRGAASISAGNDPLYVVDGIPITSQDGSTSTTEPYSPLADIDPNDIESIDILKDASASAIYGSRASNGVVLITTKKGRAGRTNVNIGYYTGITKATKLRQFLNRDQYIELFSEAATNMGYDPAEEFDGAGIDITSTTDERWSEAAFRQGSVNQFNFNLSGGSEKTRFYLSGATNRQIGMIKANDFGRNNIRLNLDHTVSDRLSLGASFAISRSINNKTADDNAFSNPVQLNALPPLQPAFDPATGELNRRTLYYNALIEVTDAFNRATSYRSFGNLNGTLRLAKGLNFRTEFGYDLLNLQEEIYRTRRTEDGAPTGYGYQNQLRNINWTTNNTFNYNNSFGDHAIDALAGITYQESDIQNVNATGRGFPNDQFTKLASAARIIGGSSTQTGYSILSYIARVNYRFRDRYLLGVSGRIDGSSRFGAENRYGVFPSVSAGWIINEESFLQNNTTISLLKLRASYGLTGNSEIGNFASRGLYSAVFYADQAGIIPSQLANPQLGWETTAQFDVGLEFGLLRNRINGQIDFYNKDTRDLLLNRPLPGISGYTTIAQNVGSLRNRGVEFSITSQNTTKAFRWSTNFNIAVNRNKVTQLNGQPIEPGSRFLGRVAVGEPLGYFYGKKFLGADPQTGDAIYEGADGKPTNNYAAAPNMKVGDPNPDFIAGLTNNFSYKGFDLSVLLQGVFGNDLYNVAGFFQSVNGDYFDNQTVDQMNRWQKPGDITMVPQARLYEGNGAGVSSRWVQDGTFVRVKTASLGYTIPSSLLRKVSMQSARVYVSGLNLFTFTKYTGYDPEVNTQYSATSNQNANVTLGHDFYTPPQQRTITFGINIGF
ncbi:SusC/RagA family TonB-linked outer membrane protein [Rudanella paleaurantiibacter]|uniref:SusC/RagA family TonB-linked outer membrane protein n=1 Tax=Rudanella paleaurantiibacter TaxID=2614655 RepID=A0A7J5U1A5_9BACT|nr:TonB-dependent receptor [Rudanella paleaurantiibacter]KAB7731420.1 SusC/RagA family TonB-linked outer membrane protein [Rudanella paleaurantiibacter]